MLTNFRAAKCTQQENCPLNIEAVEVLLGRVFFFQGVANIPPAVQKPWNEGVSSEHAGLSQFCWRPI